MMLAPVVTAHFASTQLPTASAIVVKVAGATNSNGVSLSRITSCFPRLSGARFGISVVAKRRAVLSRVSSRQKFQELWEDPSDGSDSEDENESKQVEENDLDFGSDWESESGPVTIPNQIADLSASSYEEDLVKEVEQLLEPEEMAIFQQNEKSNLEKISSPKWSPLHTLSLAGQIPFMDKLLEYGLDIDIVDKDGLTALHHAIIGKKEAVTSHLLRKGANVQARDLDGATPLHYAVQVGAMQTVKLLIKYKADVNIADNEGWTPLHVAVQSRNRDITKILLVNGADKTRRNQGTSPRFGGIPAAIIKEFWLHNGKTPLDISICYGKDFKSYDLAKLLKQLPANRYL